MTSQTPRDSNHKADSITKFFKTTKSRLVSSRKARASGARARRDVVDARRVLRTIKQFKEGKYEKEGGLGGKYLVHRTLRPSGYTYLRDVELKEPENAEVLDYFNGDKFRFDYTSRPYRGDKQFVIHMPSNFHESIAGELNTTIVTWLVDIRRGTLFGVDSSEESKRETKRIARNIHSTLATRVEYEEPHVDRLEPDLSFTSEGCTIANLVVEVAWSQKNLKLADRARRYIKGTEGAIQTVVGLNMNDIYHRRSRATFSVWKAYKNGSQWEVHTLIDNKEFIDENGQAVSGCELTLSLQDFMGATAEDQCDEYENISLKIKSTELYEFYEYALGQQMAHEATRNIRKIEREAVDTSEKMLGIETTLLKRDARNRIVMKSEELAGLRDMLLVVENEIGEMKKSMIENVEKKIDRAGNGMTVMRKVKADKVKVESKVAELETKLAKARANEENIVDRGEGSQRSRLRLGLGRSPRI
ncbi:hypothetical protein GGR58DRAFT_490747 [Xylaria digitata]|nr:hypothetical protein GGR58DRAFT_490747 [Xylaria digitata]